LEQDANGNLVGWKHKLPVLNARVYKVKFLDGEHQEISFNILAEHLLLQIDEEGNQYQIFKEIIDHCKDPKKAVEKANQYLTKGKKKHKRKMTTGWDLEVEWKDGSTSWLPLKMLKETNPVQVAKYTQANKIDAEPAFDWWVPIVLKWKSQIIAGVISQHQRAGYKFGIQLPTSMADAWKIDLENGNTLWINVLQKELGAVMIAFEIQAEALPTYQDTRRSLATVWDVKMDFTWKAQYVTGGHWMDPPKAITYSSVVSRESVRIALLMAGLNDLEVRLMDIGNAYLTAPTAEKCYIMAGDKFGLGQLRLSGMRSSTRKLLHH